MIRWKILGVLLTATLVSSCASRRAITQGENPRQLFKQVCQIGRTVKEVKGSVWFKAKSPESSGQFPAAVRAQSPSQLSMEVINPLGGTEALIRVKNEQYVVKIQGKKPQARMGSGSWGGIPLSWAPDFVFRKNSVSRCQAAKKLRSTNRFAWGLGSFGHPERLGA